MLIMWSVPHKKRYKNSKQIKKLIETRYNIQQQMFVLCFYIKIFIRKPRENIERWLLLLRDDEHYNGKKETL